MNALPPPLNPLGHGFAESVHVAGALRSLSARHGFCGYEFGSHIAIETHGAIDSSNE
jgi:hypothetical protein